MNIGTGIVIAAVLIILAWQLDKRGAWKKAGKIVLWSVVVLGLLIGAIVGYVYWDDWQRERSEAKEAAKQQAQLKVQGVNSYLGVRLGMNQKEVRYVLGPPSRSAKIESGKFEYWYYKEGGSEKKRIVFDETGILRIIACAGSYSFECPELVGIEIGDDESEIMATLGDPITAPEILENGTKTFLYGPKAGRVGFHLAKGTVTEIVVVWVRTPELSQSSN